MQVGAHVWNGDKCGVVLSNDENGVTVGYFASVETLTSDADNPSPLSSSPTIEESAPEPAAVVDEPPAPAVKPAAESAGTSGDVAPGEVDPLAALSEDERATYTRLQGKLEGKSS